MNADELDALRLELAEILVREVEPIFPSVYRFTLVARHRGRPDGTVVVTNDSWAAATAALAAEVERLEPVSDLARRT